MTASTVRHLMLVPDQPMAPMVVPVPVARRRWFARLPWWWPRSVRARLTVAEEQIQSAFACIQVLSGRTA
jgi:hypothetical protein